LALGEDSRPDWLFEQCRRRIAQALDNGQIALAQIIGLHIPVGELDASQLTRLAAVSALIKANYDPDQPRVPAGQAGGGRWTSDGGDPADPPKDDGRNDPGASAFDAYLQNIGYPLSQAMSQVARDLYRLFRDSGGDIGTLREYLAERGLKLDDLPDVIRSAFDPPKPLRELKTDKPPRGFDTEAQLRAYLGDPLPGYEWHHIIEQNGQYRPDLTSSEGVRTWIQHTDNMVQVPVIKHYCVSGLMSAKVPPGMRLRDWVKPHEPAFQREMGLMLLHNCGAIR
jgi:hypothetical protein